jgi:putative phage P2 gpU/probable bacteriophage V tail protein|nr:MAG TPA: hypothetical protein [Caudoviricetes sp.]
MSYALLGNIAFDLLNAPTGFDESYSANFVEHQVLSGKPRLQAMGVELAEITLNLHLHYKLGSVEGRYQELIAAKDSQQVLALVLGFSKFKGRFVITELTGTTLFTDNKGNALARDVQLTLREFVGDEQQGLLGEALQLGANSPLASLLPEGALVGMNAVKNVIAKGVQVYRQAKQVVDEGRNTIAAMKSFVDDPLGALAALPYVLNNVSGALGGLGDVVGMADTFKTLTQGIAGANEFIRDLGVMTEDLNAFQTLFKLGLNDNKMGEWFTLGEAKLADVGEAIERMAAPAAKMTAWIAIRADNPTVEA